jgi:hypothetical protein
LRAAGKPARWRVEGVKEGAEAGVMAGAAGAAVATGAAFLPAVLAAGAVFFDDVLGMTLRAIGRGFGNGTFGLAQASAANDDNPTAKARLVAKAVDRNAAVRTERVTEFLGGESFNPLRLRSI